MSSAWGDGPPPPMRSCAWALAGSLTVWLLVGLALWWWLR